MPTKSQMGYQISLSTEFRDYTDRFYEVFLDLTRRLSLPPLFLTDLENVTKLHYLLFLLEEDILSVREEKLADGSRLLFLSVKDYQLD